MIMPRFLTIALTVLALMLAVGASAQGASAARTPTFKKAPTFTDFGITLNASGTIAGLQPSTQYPNETKVFLTASGTLTVNCHDTTGSVLGEATVSFGSVQGLQDIRDSEIRSNTPFSVTTGIPGAPTPAQAGCPSGTSYLDFLDATYTIARVVVIQGANIPLDQTFSL
jgi:hypothetical protein